MPFCWFEGFLLCRVVVRLLPPVTLAFFRLVFWLLMLISASTFFRPASNPVFADWGCQQVRSSLPSERGREREMHQPPNRLSPIPPLCVHHPSLLPYRAVLERYRGFRSNPNPTPYPQPYFNRTFTYWPQLLPAASLPSLLLSTIPNCCDISLSNRGHGVAWAFRRNPRRWR